MTVSMDAVKDVRARTGAGIVDCRNALVETKGDEEKAIAILQEQGKAKAMKRAGKEAGEGCIGSYVHTNGKVAALVSLRCETEFVARNEMFRELVHDLAMQVAAMDPENTEELLEQPFFRDQGKTTGDHISAVTSGLGENIHVEKFVRLEL